MKESTASVRGERPPRTKLVDRRASVRYLSESDSLSYSFSKSADVCLNAHVHDLSRDGIGLILSERVEIGTILHVELHGKSQSLPCFLLARVMWTAECADGSLMVGCQFSRSLSDLEMRALL